MPTLEYVLNTEGPASVLIQFLKLDDKRNLRLVSNASKDAVDKTVTSVSNINNYDESFYYARALSNNSNWKGIRSLEITPSLEPECLTVIVEAGLSKLESFRLCLDRGDGYWEMMDIIPSADKMVKAEWKLKKLEIGDFWSTQDIPSEWFGVLVSDANWPLEELTLYYCNDAIASLIAVSDWKLKFLCLEDAGSLSPEGIETLMQGSWVSTVESLTFGLLKDVKSNGRRAICQATHRAGNLLELTMTKVYDGTDDLILGDGLCPGLGLVSRSMDMNSYDFWCVGEVYKREQ